MTPTAETAIAALDQLALTARRLSRAIIDGGWDPARYAELCTQLAALEQEAARALIEWGLARQTKMLRDLGLDP